MAAADLTDARVRELFDYDSATGRLTWRVAHGRFDRIPAGTQAGTITPWGYLVVRLYKRTHPLHRVIWLHAYGRWPPCDIDHINGVRTDNRLANLREASRSQNMQNRLRPQKNSRTGINGIYFDNSRNRFVAVVKLNGVRAYERRFKTLDEAIAANDKARARLHPFAVNHDSARSRTEVRFEKALSQPPEDPEGC